MQASVINTKSQINAAVFLACRHTKYHPSPDKQRLQYLEFALWFCPYRQLQKVCGLECITLKVASLK
jgi:hypothetical protein